jgi:short-subunit dehydrogenase
VTQPKRPNVLITGASSGLGAEMARQFAARGHALALAARRQERLDELEAEIRAAHPAAVVATYALDVNDHDQVFEVTKQAGAELGHLDRFIVNAGLGKGARIGSGKFYANKETAETNFVAALAQCEAAMEHFYARKSGHLVVISSISAMRGMPSSMTAYAATKAGIAHLAEGIRSDLQRSADRRGGGHDIAVTTLFPGYIASEMNEKVQQKTKLMVDTATGVRAMVKAIEDEVDEAAVPAWPWAPLGAVMKHAPLGIVRRLV